MKKPPSSSRILGTFRSDPSDTLLRRTHRDTHRTHLRSVSIRYLMTLLPRSYLVKKGFESWLIPISFFAPRAVWPDRNHAWIFEASPRLHTSIRKSARYIKVERIDNSGILVGSQVFKHPRASPVPALEYDGSFLIVLSDFVNRPIEQGVKAMPALFGRSSKKPRPTSSLE